MTETDMNQAEPVTFMNIFEMPPTDVETFRLGWRQRVQIVAAAPGFRDAQLYEATSSSQRLADRLRTIAVGLSAASGSRRLGS